MLSAGAMTLSDFADRFAAPRRAPLIAALVALLASLPGLFTLPPTDRDESRFAEASAQMLESGDFTNIMFQDTPRYKKPVGIYWLQAASVAALSDPEAREIWAYRIPSVLGAMLAAAACAWGALAFLEPGAAAAAGALLAATTVLSSESTLATTDAALCGAVTLAMAAIGAALPRRARRPGAAPLDLAAVLARHGGRGAAERADRADGRGPDRRSRSSCGTGAPAG